MDYIYDKKLEKLVGKFEKVLNKLNIEYSIKYDIQFSAIKIIIDTDERTHYHYNIYTHTADFEDIQERLVDILSKVLMEVI